MDANIYKFQHGRGMLDKKYYYVRDYWEYYSTGIESVVEHNLDLFKYTKRENAERPEVITNRIYKDPDMADAFLAINNQNLLWATPFSLDAFQDAVDFRMNYLEYLMKDRIQRKYDEDGTRYYDPGSVGDICWNKCREEIYEEDQAARTVIVIDPQFTQEALRKLRSYLKGRRVY